jgi:epsilon-lactone hydrolase
MRFMTTLAMLCGGMFLPVIGIKAAEPSPEQAVAIDHRGTVLVPALEVPLSSYMSDQAKQAFVKAANEASAISDRQSLSISQIRAVLDSDTQKFVDRAVALYPVTIEARKFGNVPTKVILPKGGVSIANKGRVLINVHGGGFYAGAGAESLIESIPVAALGKLKVITIDYRQGPEYKFPAASEDTASVYKALLRDYKPHNIGIYGCSAGGILSAMAVAWLENEKLPLPGAIGIFGAGAFGGWYADPASAGSWGGDSRFTTPPLVGKKPVPIDATRAPPRPEYISAYLSNADFKDPLVSPALSPAMMSKFPPTLLITGTRAYDMSAAVQTQRALTKAGVEADLHIWDGMGHCFFIDVDLPESQEAFAVVTKFFNTRLGR